MSLPKIVRVKQEFPRPRVEDISGALREECQKEEIKRKIKPGMSVAITAGSRGISNVPEILRSLVGILKDAGASPFIVPAMGSHGGATAEGQVGILNSLGVTEEAVGAAIRSSMEVVKLGETERGVPVFMDGIASEADGVIIVGRIKQHTDFHAEIESGLLKMAAIGLGKREAALTLHALGVPGIRDHMVEAGEVVFGSGKVLFGVGIVENAYEETAMVEAVPPERVHERETALLKESYKLVPKLPVSEMDILFVDEIGKNFSGTGMDTNVVGRFRIPGAEEPKEPEVKYLVVGDASEASHGNTAGIGLADITTRRLFEKIDYGAMNQNVLTSTFIERAKVPMVMENDREAIEAAIRCNWGVAPEDTRFVRIPNTLHIREVDLSENLVSEALDNGNVEVVGEPGEMDFDGSGNFPAFERAAVSSTISD
ncbi:MAG: lactate racemase domain-containing protein [Rubrobacteraceae bacterium]